MPLLEYQSPCDKPKVDWGSRYKRFGPAFALAYVPFLITYVIISFKIDDEGTYPDSLYYRVLEQVVCFPTVSLLVTMRLSGGFLLLFGGAINAFLWGVSAVGLWHLAHVAKGCFRRVS